MLASQLAWITEANECGSAVLALDVHDADDATDLAKALRCSGSAELTVDWYGDVQLPQTLTVGNSTILNITGSEGAIIDGGGRIQLFAISGESTLNLRNVSLEGGWAPDGGGAISASETSQVFLRDCKFLGNNATYHGSEFSRWLNSFNGLHAVFE